MTMCVSSKPTNVQLSCDSLGKITWVRYDFLSQGKISDIPIRVCKNACSLIRVCTLIKWITVSSLFTWWASTSVIGLPWSNLLKQGKHEICTPTFVFKERVKTKPLIACISWVGAETKFVGDLLVKLFSSVIKVVQKNYSRQVVSGVVNCLVYKHQVVNHALLGLKPSCIWNNTCIWAGICDFQQCGVLTSVDSNEPVQPSFKLRNSKCCSVSSLIFIDYSCD